jgi:hypothetical protein
MSSIDRLTPGIFTPGTDGLEFAGFPFPQLPARKTAATQRKNERARGVGKQRIGLVKVIVRREFFIVIQETSDARW